MSWSGAHGARFWHNDWLQSCGSPLRNPTVATIAPWRLSITGKTTVWADGEAVGEGGLAGLFQWQRNCYPVLELSWLTGALVDTWVINLLVIRQLVNDCLFSLTGWNGNNTRYFQQMWRNNDACILIHPWILRSTFVTSPFLQENCNTY